MSKNSKLLMKLIKASGGWENFLYETLKEICAEIDINVGGSLGEAVDNALEIIEVYEDQCGEEAVQQHQEKLVPPIGVSQRVVHKKVVPVKSVSPPQLKPRKLQVRVGIDKDAGWCQGELPLPANHMIVNKGQLIITTVNGLEMARGSEDGQVKAQDVSGQISSKGKYRLVFKNTQLGSALIKFEVMPIPLAPVEIRPPASAVPVQITPAMIAAKMVEVDATSKAVPIEPPRPKGGIKEVG